MAKPASSCLLALIYLHRVRLLRSRKFENLKKKKRRKRKKALPAFNLLSRQRTERERRKMDVSKAVKKIIESCTSDTSALLKFEVNRISRQKVRFFTPFQIKVELSVFPKAKKDEKRA